jgi:hypothetical protein
MKMLGVTSSGTIQDTLVKHMPPKKVMNAIIQCAAKYNVPFEILLGIYLIEIHGRPFWFRFAENLILCIRLLFGLVFKSPIPNYTIGRFQIGVATILKNVGYECDIHSRTIQLKDATQILLIIKSMWWRNNLLIACKYISTLYRECSDLRQNRAIRYLGISYNGHVSYGLFLEYLVGRIQNDLLLPR